MNGRARRGGLAGKLVAAGFALLALGWLMSRMPETTPGLAWWPWLMVAGAGLWVVVFAAWRQHRGGSAGLVYRWSNRSRRNQGVASPYAILRVASRSAMRRRATVLRPSLVELSRWRRLRTPTREFATPVGASGCCGFGRRARTSHCGSVGRGPARRASSPAGFSTRRVQ